MENHLPSDLKTWNHFTQRCVKGSLMKVVLVWYLLTQVQIKALNFLQTIQFCLKKFNSDKTYQKVAKCKSCRKSSILEGARWLLICIRYCGDLNFAIALSKISRNRKLFLPTFSALSSSSFLYGYLSAEFRPACDLEECWWEPCPFSYLLQAGYRPARSKPNGSRRAKAPAQAAAPHAPTLPKEIRDKAPWAGPGISRRVCNSLIVKKKRGLLFLQEKHWAFFLQDCAWIRSCKILHMKVNSKMVTRWNDLKR